MNGLENKSIYNPAYKRLTSDLKTHTLESKMMEKDMPHKRKIKENRDNNIHITQNRIWNKVYNNKDKEGHHIMINKSNQEDITFININAPSTIAPKYIKQILTHIKGETDRNTINIENFHNPLT